MDLSQMYIAPEDRLYPEGTEFDCDEGITSGGYYGVADYDGDGLEEKEEGLDHSPRDELRTEGAEMELQLTPVEGPAEQTRSQQANAAGTNQTSTPIQGT